MKKENLSTYFWWAVSLLVFMGMAYQGGEETVLYWMLYHLFRLVASVCLLLIVCFLSFLPFWLLGKLLDKLDLSYWWWKFTNKK